MRSASSNRTKEKNIVQIHTLLPLKIHSITVGSFLSNQNGTKRKTLTYNSQNKTAQNKLKGWAGKYVKL